jgi:protein-L-isoaspartate(D-aspartate) O-methyltransferase
MKSQVAADHFGRDAYMRRRRRWILLAVSACVILLVSIFLVQHTQRRGRPESSEDDETPAATRPPLATSPAPQGTEQEFSKARSSMVEYQIRQRGVRDPKVLDAMEAVPRHEFVPDDYMESAYSDGPLPIGYGQTISQPYIVALMTELLELEPGDKVLEIGTGSGYQAAVLAEVTDDVYTVEIIPELAESSAARLAELGYDRIHTRNADGYYGWPEHAPYDAIIVTAAPDHIPQPLVEQLQDGGRMVIPVGPVGWYQTLWLVTKENGDVEYHNKGGVTFVPLTGEH